MGERYPEHLCPTCQAGNPYVPPNKWFWCPGCETPWLAFFSVQRGPVPAADGAPGGDER